MKKLATSVAILAVLAAAGVVVWLTTRPSTASSDTATHTAKTTTAEITQRDLVAYNQTTATLGFTTSVTVSSPVAGTVTSIVPTGTKIAAGTVVASIDGTPVVAMIGDVPSYRDLSKGVTTGIDVRQLKANLVMLGFDPNGTMAIDETYDTATATAVTAWEDSLGLTGDGKVTKGEIVFVPGELLVDTLSASVGSGVGAGTALLQGRQTARSFLLPATNPAHGAITHIAPAGTAVTTGTVLFWQNGFPVVAIEGDASTTPSLARALNAKSSDGVDVKLLETFLSTAGFDPGKVLTIDDHWDLATSAAVVQWLGSLGIPADPASVTVPVGSFIVVPGGLFTGTPNVAEGAIPTGDTVVTSLTTAAREITTTAPVGGTTFVVGATIDVMFPDGTVSPGTVVKVGNVATNASNTPGATPSVPITIDVAGVPATVDAFVQIPVTLQVVAQEEKQAFVVPVSALVALAEGGFAVEVVTGQNADGTNATKLVGVKPGMYADGFVSITGTGVTAGSKVVVPS